MRVHRWFTLGVLLGLGGCGDSGNPLSSQPEVPLNPLKEQSFARDAALRARPDQVVVLLLESVSAGAHDLDTGEVGVDRIPYLFERTAVRRFAVEQRAGDAFSARLVDAAAGEVVVQVDAQQPRAELEVAAGEYLLEVQHGNAAGESVYLFVRAGAVVVSRDCPGCFLSGVDLSSSLLSGVDLSGADLNEANLWTADLSGADLSGARLHKVFMPKINLKRARLSGADLSEASMDQAEMLKADLSGADLSAAGMRSANLASANLQGARLLDTDLKRSNLFNVDLRRADLRRADLRGVNLRGARIDSARLDSALWPDARLCAPGSIGECK